MGLPSPGLAAVPGSHENGDREVLPQSGEEAAMRRRTGTLGVWPRGDDEVVVLMVRSKGSIVPTDAFIVGTLGEEITLRIPRLKRRRRDR